MEKYFEKRTQRINLVNADTGEIMETLFVCAECVWEECRKIALRVREERIKNYVFRPEIRSKLDRGKHISNYDLRNIVEQIEGPNSCYTLFVDYYSREQMARRFNEIFGTDIK